MLAEEEKMAKPRAHELKPRGPRVRLSPHRSPTSVLPTMNGDFCMRLTPVHTYRAVRPRRETYSESMARRIKRMPSTTRPSSHSFSPRRSVTLQI